MHPHASLLHPVYGVAAQDIRRRIGISSQGRIAEMERQVDSTRRALVKLRGFGGLYLPATQERITPNHQQRIRVVSEDESVVVEKGHSPHDLNLQVNPAALPDPGCSAAVTRFRVPGGDIVEVTDCDDIIDLEGDCIDITKTGAKEITFSRRGVTGILVNSAECEDACYTVDFIDEPDGCGVCFRWEDSGAGGTCAIRGHLVIPEGGAPTLGDTDVYLHLCTCTGDTYIVSAKKVGG